MASMEEKFRNELNAHIKLSNLYKVRGSFDRREDVYVIQRGVQISNVF